MYVDQEVSHRPLIVPMDVYVCEDESDKGAPKYLDNSEFRDRFVFVILLANSQHNAGISKLTKLEADLTSVPKDKLNKERGQDGKMYYNVNFDFEMTCGARGVKFALVHDEKRYNVHQEFI